MRNFVTCLVRRVCADCTSVLVAASGRSARVGGLLSGRPTGRGGGGAGWVGVLEILGGWVSKHHPPPVGVGQFWVPG